MEFTRTERKTLRELAGEIYEAEVRELLEELDASFSLWRQGEMPSSELLTEIHEFHQQQSRELWSMYQSLDDATVVARGIGFGFMSEAKVPLAIRDKLNVSYWAQRSKDEGEGG